MDNLPSKLRIGPPAVTKGLFKMPGRNDVIRHGKRFEIPQYLTEIGLEAYEFSGGRMSKFTDNDDYKKFRANVEKYNLKVSLHGPYYIVLTSSKEDVYERSIERVANTYAWASYLNATRVVIHPGSYEGIHKQKTGDLMDIMKGKSSNSSKNEKIKVLIKKIVAGMAAGKEMAYEKFPELKNQFNKIILAPETMGKLGQLGTVEEVITICKEVGLDTAQPCIDFGHLYARNLGKKTGRKLYEDVFTRVEEELGTKVLKNLHIHYSKIEYTPKGEAKHVLNTDTTYGPEIEPLFEICLEQDLTPTIINESPELELDAKILIDIWNKMRNLHI